MARSSRNRKEINAFLKKHGYTWHKKVDPMDQDFGFDETTDEPKFTWVLKSRDGREVTKAEAFDEIEFGVEHVQQQREEKTRQREEKAQQLREAREAKEKAHQAEVDAFNAQLEEIRELGDGETVDSVPAEANSVRSYKEKGYQYTIYESDTAWYYRVGGIEYDNDLINEIVEYKKESQTRDDVPSTQEKYHTFVMVTDRNPRTFINPHTGDYPEGTVIDREVSSVHGPIVVASYKMEDGEWVCLTQDAPAKWQKLTRHSWLLSQVMTTSEVAEAYGLEQTSVNKAIERGQIKPSECRKAGGTWLILADAARRVWGKDITKAATTWMICTAVSVLLAQLV